MPYPNVPKPLWPKMERCVSKVKSSGRKVNAYAVCYSSVVGEGVSRAARKRQKGGKK